MDKGYRRRIDCILLTTFVMIQSKKEYYVLQKIPARPLLLFRLKLKNWEALSEKFVFSRCGTRFATAPEAKLREIAREPIGRIRTSNLLPRE